MTTRADRLVERFILDQWREDHGGHAHCESLRVVKAEAEDSVYGCDTGCEYMCFTALLACEHKGEFKYDFGDFGELGSLIRRLERDYPDVV